MAEAAKLRAHVMSRFCAARGAEGGERDRVSEVPFRTAGGAGGAAPRDGQTFVKEARAQASGEAVRAGSSHGEAGVPKSDSSRGTGCAASAARGSGRQP